MQDLLSKGIDEHGNIRTEQTHAFKDSELGRIPVEWHTAPISKYGAKNKQYLRTGPFGSALNTKHWAIDGIPVFTIGSLGEGTILENELLYISEQTAKPLDSFRVFSGDIVFSRVADIGRAFVVSEKQSGWIISSNFMRISLDKTSVNPSFLYRNIVFNHKIHSQLQNSSNTGGRDLVNSSIISGLIFPWASINEQTQIENRILAFENQQTVLSNQLLKLQRTKAALMQDLLSGNVRVNGLI
jgi:type I restriction enzyme S subunit